MVLGKRKEGRGLSFFFFGAGQVGTVFSFFRLSFSLRPLSSLVHGHHLVQLGVGGGPPGAVVHDDDGRAVPGGRRGGRGGRIGCGGRCAGGDGNGPAAAAAGTPRGACRGQEGGWPGGRAGPTGDPRPQGPPGRGEGRHFCFVFRWRSPECCALALVPLSLSPLSTPDYLTWPPARAAHSLPPSGVASHCLARPPTPQAHTLPDPRPTQIQGGLPARPAAWERASAQKGGWWPRGARATPRRGLPSPPPKMNECV